MSKAKARDVVEDAINDSADIGKDDDDEKPSPAAGKAARNTETAGVLPDYRWSRLKNTLVIAKREFLAYFDSLPTINEHLTDDEIIGYDENGLPT